MGKWILVVLVAAVAFFSWNSGRSARGFEAAAKEMNQRAPFDMAPGVRLDKAELQGKELLMRVTLTAEEPSAPNIQQQQTIHLLKQSLTTGWCTNEGIRGALDKGFKISTVANRANGSELTQFSVAREECICSEQKGDVCVIKY